MKTATHYTDNAGQHSLPECLQNRTFEDGDLIIDWDARDAMGDDEADDIKRALRALGFDTETDAEGVIAVENSILSDADEREILAEIQDSEDELAAPAAVSAYALELARAYGREAGMEEVRRAIRYDRGETQDMPRPLP